MNYKDALVELKHGHRITHLGIVTEDGITSYIYNHDTNLIEATNKSYQGIVKWTLTVEQFEEDAKKFNCEFEIYD